MSGETSTATTRARHRSHGESELPRTGTEINDLAPLVEPVLKENC